MLQVRRGGCLASLGWGWWSGMSVSWRCYRWEGVGAWPHWPGVGGLGCRSAGDVTGEKGWVPGFTGVGGLGHQSAGDVTGERGRCVASLSWGWWSGMSIWLVVWDVSQLELLQVRGGRYSASLSWGWWSLTLISWRCYRCVCVCGGGGYARFTDPGLVALDVSQMEMLQVRGGRYSSSLSRGWWSGISVRWRCYRWDGVHIWLRWAGVGDLGCQPDGDVSGEMGYIFGFAELGLVIWDVSRMEMLQVRGGTSMLWPPSMRLNLWLLRVNAVALHHWLACGKSVGSECCLSNDWWRMLWQPGVCACCSNWPSSTWTLQDL